MLDASQATLVPLTLMSVAPTDLSAVLADLPVVPATAPGASPPASDAASQLDPAMTADLPPLPSPASLEPATSPGSPPPALRPMALASTSTLDAYAGSFGAGSSSGDSMGWGSGGFVTSVGPGSISSSEGGSASGSGEGSSTVADSGDGSSSNAGSGGGTGDGFTPINFTATTARATPRR